MRCVIKAYIYYMNIYVYTGIHAPKDIHLRMRKVHIDSRTLPSFKMERDII